MVKSKIKVIILNLILKENVLARLKVFYVIYLGETKIGQYDLSYHDVSKKVERQRNFIENLKKIDV